MNVQRTRHLGRELPGPGAHVIAAPRRLTVDHAPVPALAGTDSPRLGWAPPPGGGTASAHQVLVASDPALLLEGAADVWDSGRRSEAGAISSTYDGPALASDRGYHWAVRTWHGDDPSRWSAPAAFRTGLLRAGDWHAEWIGGTHAERRTGDDPNPEPLLRRVVRVRPDLRAARLYVSAVGYVRLWIDGRRVGDHVLEPGFTNVDERVLYAAHDVTDHLRGGGEFVVAAALGRGFRGLTTESVWEWSEASWHGEPALLFQLHLDHADGSTERVVSDASWRVADGPTRYDSVYAGESFDAGLDPAGWRERGFDDTQWSPAVVAARPPRGRLEAQTAEAIRQREDVAARSVEVLDDGAHVVDFGRTLAGWATLKGAAARGTEVRLCYGELRHADGRVRHENELAARRSQTDEYVFAGSGDEQWTPSYSWKGFRYVEVRGLDTVTPAMLVARQVSSDVPDAGSFESDDDMYSWLETAMRATVRNNLYSVPTDTPFFEKNGWTGDVHVALWSLLYQFDLSRFFAKWLEDLRAEQLDSGSFPIFVPSSPTFRAAAHLSPAWTGVYPSLLEAYHLAYDDLERVRSHWEPLKRYISFVLSTLEGTLPEDAHGDWLAPADDGAAIPPEDRRLAGTAYSYRSLRAAARIADLLGHNAVAEAWRTAAAGVRARFDAAFFDTAAGHYRAGDTAGYRQTSNLLPVAFGLVGDLHRDGVVAGIVADVAARGDHLNTGCLGTSVLLPVLTDHGYGELAHRLITQTTYPSWGYWRAQGGDTLWEAWGEYARSRGHFFLGSPVEWLYGHVGGIRPTAPGYRRISVRPHLLGSVGTVSARVQTARGPVGVRWRRSGDRAELQVDVPGAAVADVALPVSSHAGVREAPSGVESWSVRDGRPTALVGSGSHRFVLDTGPTEAVERSRTRSG